MASLPRMMYLRQRVSRLLRSDGLISAADVRGISISRHQLRQKEESEEKHATNMGGNSQTDRIPVESVDPDPDELEKFARQTEVLTSIDECRQDMPPFVKGILDGKVNTRVLSYPDVMENDRYYSLLARCQHISDHLEAKKKLVGAIDGEKRISKDILLPLRNLNAFGLQCERQSGGQGLGMTETMRVLEEFSVNMSLSEAVAVSNTVGLATLVRFAPEGAKKKYLRKLASGEATAAYCLADGEAGADATRSECVAQFQRDSNEWVIRGEKLWVSNASTADVFVVFARTQVVTPELTAADAVTAFVVERGAAGLKVETPQAEKVGLKGLDTSSVTLDSVRVGEDALLGEVNGGHFVFVESILKERAFVGARVSAALRALLSDTIQDALGRHTFQLNLSEFELVKERVARMASALFTLESMTYLTAGLADVMLVPDVELEVALTRLYTMKVAKQVVEGCLALYGDKAYLSEHPAARLKRDLEALELWEGTTDLNHLHAAQICMQHILLKRYEYENQFRNPFTAPWRLAKYIKWERDHKRDEVKGTLQIHRDVHPSLDGPARTLEYSVLRLQYAIDRTFSKFFYIQGFKDVDMNKIAELAAECYAIASALARANRSYCQGHREVLFKCHLANTTCLVPSIFATNQLSTFFLNTV